MTSSKVQSAETLANYSARTRYTPKEARRYRQRDTSRHRAEMALVERAFVLVPKGRVLDVPCGCGRVGLLLAQQGHQVTCADLSPAMRAMAAQAVEQARLAVPVEAADVERLPFADRGFDTLVSFRLFHHFPNREVRERAVRELCRVAGRHVVLSYLTPFSFTVLRRWLQAKLGGRRSHKHATSLSEVRGYFEGCGFRLTKDFAQQRFIHTLHLAVFERV